MTTRQLVDDMSHLGVDDHGILMVHSSLSSMGNVIGGANGLVQALRDKKSGSGTLVMPSHSWRKMNSGCRRFSLGGTESCVGVTCETFRRQPDVIRSLHPTHSLAARGPDAHWITDGHENAASPCGTGTPYEKLIRRSAQVLFLGVDLSTNTLFHTIETIAGLSYSLGGGEEKFTIELSAGIEFEKCFRLHRQGVPRRFAEAEELLVENGAARVGRVGAARAILIQSARFAEVLYTKLSQDHGFLCAVSKGETAGNSATKGS